MSHASPGFGWGIRKRTGAQCSYTHNALSYQLQWVDCFRTVLPRWCYPEKHYHDHVAVPALCSPTSTRGRPQGLLPSPHAIRGLQLHAAARTLAQGQPSLPTSHAQSRTAQLPLSR